MHNPQGNPQPPSPSFRAVVAIAQHVGSGMKVTRFQAVRFPTGTVQVWAFTPHPSVSSPGAGDAASVVAVFLKGQGIDRWTPLLSPFENAVAHYQRLAASEQRRYSDAALRTRSCPPVDAGADRPTAAGEPS